MNKNIIKLFAILMMCFVLVTVLAACGDNNGDEERDAEIPSADVEKKVKSKKQPAKKTADKPATSATPIENIPERKGINLGKNAMGGADINSGLAGGFGDSALAPRPKRKKAINPVDEGKVGVGDAPIKNDEGDLGTFAEQKANLGDLTKPNGGAKRKPKAKPAPVEEAHKEEVAEAPEKVENVKPKIRKSTGSLDPWGLSPTTLNQKYDTPSGKNRTFAPIDESKVGVGNAPIRMKSASELLSTFGEETISQKPVVKKNNNDQDGE